MMRQPAHAILATAAALLACSCQNTIAVESFATPCHGPVTVEVTVGLEPQINWAPQCGISSLAVLTVPSTPGAVEAVMWWFTVPEQQPVGPGIRYGQAPARANSRAPLELRAGTTYRVRVTQTLGLDVSIAEGVRVFTPLTPFDIMIDPERARGAPAATIERPHRRYTATHTRAR